MSEGADSFTVSPALHRFSVAAKQ